MKGSELYKQDSEFFSWKEKKKIKRIIILQKMMYDTVVAGTYGS